MSIDEPIRWTLLRAQKEFGSNRDTIKTKLDQASEPPGEDGCYSTQQIITSLFTDVKAERARLTREQADKIALENSLTRRELVNMEDVERVWAEWMIGIRNSVKEQEISAEAKQNVLAAMRDVDSEEFFKDNTTDEPESTEGA